MSSVDSPGSSRHFYIDGGAFSVTPAGEYGQGIANHCAGRFLQLSALLAEAGEFGATGRTLGRLHIPDELGSEGGTYPYGPHGAVLYRAKNCS
jgi:hypothetical protein